MNWIYNYFIFSWAKPNRAIFGVLSLRYLTNLMGRQSAVNERINNL